MLFLAATLPLFLLARSAVALPARRQIGSITIQDAMASMYNMYLQSQGVTHGAFYPLYAGESEINFAGVADSEGMPGTNHAIYRTADSLPHMDTWNSTGDLMFSVQYRHFIQALINATNDATSPEAAEALSDLAKNKTVACSNNLWNNQVARCAAMPAICISLPRKNHFSYLLKRGLLRIQF
ncbi:hypothetical protein DFH09DRAFT_1111104 [Mycena vulgaris]|nr:hypothetical protein DFH09DRAFT_1111104 [Mycena vulgaris]